jgi:isocitrate dehydrogenase
MLNNTYTLKTTKNMGGTLYMAHYRIGVLCGDGIGPEIVKATVDVISTALLHFQVFGIELANSP